MAPGRAPVSPGNFPTIGSPIVTPAGTHMTLRQHDEFTGVFRPDLNKLYYDPKLWIPSFWQGTSERTLTGNGEAQYYMDHDYAGNSGSFEPPLSRPNPFEFLNDPAGILRISAFQVPQSKWGNYFMGTQRRFCSGMLCSMPDIHKDQPYFPTQRTSPAARPGWRFKYGYVELRAKLPGDYGAWPAFWFLSDNTPDGFQFSSAASDYFGRVNEAIPFHRWGPELDDFEFFGHRPTTHSYGYVKAAEDASGDFQMFPKGFNITSDYHTWGIEVNASRIKLSFDGGITYDRATFPSWNNSVGWYTLINFAVGGNWYAQEINSGQYGRDNIVDVNGAPVNVGSCGPATVSAPFNQTAVSPSSPHYDIDYVRWYE